MNLDWATLIAERDEWIAKNFPPGPDDIPGNNSILGCIEELGELAHAHLKRKQGIRGTPEEHDAAAKDAIGDITVYLLGVMSAHRWDHLYDPPGLIISDSAEQVLFELSFEMGFLGRFAGVTANATDEMWHMTINNIIHYLQDFCHHRGWDYEQIVMDTWGHVKERDWNKHREDGAAKGDPLVKDPESKPYRPPLPGEPGALPNYGSEERWLR